MNSKNNKLMPLDSSNGNYNQMPCSSRTESRTFLIESVSSLSSLNSDEEFESLTNVTHSRCKSSLFEEKSRQHLDMSVIIDDLLLRIKDVTIMMESLSRIKKHSSLSDFPQNFDTTRLSNIIHLNKNIESVNMNSKTNLEFKKKVIRRNKSELELVQHLPWKSILLRTAFGLVQIIGGAGITVFSDGKCVPLGLNAIIEGIEDLWSVIRICYYKEKEVHWLSWSIDKFVVYTVHFVCSGINTLKIAAASIYNGIRSLHISGTKPITYHFISGIILALKSVGVCIANVLTAKIMLMLFHTGIDKTLLPQIQKLIIKKTEKMLENALLSNDHISNMLEMDHKRNNNFYRTVIIEESLKILNSESLENNNLVGIFFQISHKISLNVSFNQSEKNTFPIGYMELIETYLYYTTFSENFIKQLIHNINQLEIRVNEDRGVALSFSNQYNTSFKAKFCSIPSGNVYYTAEELSKEISNNVSQKICNDIGNRIMNSLVIHKCIDSFARIWTEQLNVHMNKELRNYNAMQRILWSQNNYKKHHKNLSKEQRNAFYKPIAFKALKIIEDLYRGGPVGLIHLGPLSDEINRPINIWNRYGYLVHVIGPDKDGNPIDIEYQKRDNHNSGHWSLRGGENPSLSPIYSGENDCLFNAVAFQINRDPVELRINVVLRLLEDFDVLANQVSDIETLKLHNELALLIGGCTYKGNSSEDARTVLDDSQGAEGHAPHRSLGHPRGHVIGNKPYNVHNFSINDTKTAFSNSTIQDDYTHVILSSPKGQNAMENLNNTDKYLQEVTVTADELRELGLEPPDVYVFQDGKCMNPDKPLTAIAIKVIIRHFRGEQNNKDAPPHITTEYPMADRSEVNAVLQQARMYY